MGEADERPALKRGYALGRYTIVDRVGRGAMGEVYRAHDTALDRMVAVKVLTCAVDDDPLRESITIREGQMLARVHHPNVVGVFDVGLSSGWPFIALELVDGQPLSQWAHSDRPTALDLLTLLNRLAGGLAAIHEAGLIHRDIKPSNILVDGAGVPRIADLGVAKLVGDAAGDPRAANATLVGTPKFMAPELHEGDPATPASDVFSLCKAIDHVLPESDTTAAGHRLRRVLHRGLVTEADARPSAVTLQGLTRPEPRTQRNVVVGLLGVLVGAGGLYAWVERPHSRCAAPDQELEGIWDVSKRSKVRTAILATESPVASATWQRVEGGLDSYAQEWLDRYSSVCEKASRIEQDVDAEREFRCLIRRRIELHALVEALATLEAGSIMRAAQAVSELEPLVECLGGEADADIDPEQAETVLVLLAASRSNRKLGRYAQGRRLADEALASGADATSSLRGRALLERGQAELSEGMRKTALESYREAYYAATEAGDAKLTLGTTKALTSAYVTLEQSSEASHWIRLSGIFAGQLELNTWDLAYQKGLVAELDGDIEGAVSLYRDALEQQGGRARDQAHVVHNDLGNALKRLGRRAEALEELERGYTSCVATLGESHPHATALLGAVGATYIELGRHEEAAEILESVLEQFEASVGPSHPFIAVASNNLGLARVRTGRIADALALYRRAEAVDSKLYGEHSKPAVLARIHIAEALSEAGRSQEAVSKLVALEGEVILSQDPHLRWTLVHELARALAKMGDEGAALERASLSLDLAHENFGDEHPYTMIARAFRADVLTAAGRAPEAMALLEPVIDRYSRADLDPGTTAQALFAFARGLQSRGELSRARTVAAQAARLVEPDASLEIRAWLDSHPEPAARYEP